MTTDCKEDPMDLGPFFQTYILRNPFQKSSEFTTNNAKSLDNRKRSRSSSPLDHVLQRGQGDRRTSDAYADKGHIGSNYHYALMLKQLKVSQVHQQVQNWLWDEFIHVDSYGGTTAIGTLLKEVQTKFADMTSAVLSRIMAFTFPHCQKIVNKVGSFYQGLVQKPKWGHYQDAALMRCVLEVNQGRVSVAYAAALHRVSEATVASLVYWPQHDKNSSLVCEADHDKPSSQNSADAKCTTASRIHRKRRHIRLLDNDDNSESERWRFKYGRPPDTDISVGNSDKQINDCSEVMHIKTEPATPSTADESASATTNAPSSDQSSTFNCDFPRVAAAAAAPRSDAVLNRAFVQLIDENRDLRRLLDATNRKLATRNQLNDWLCEQLKCAGGRMQTLKDRIGEFEQQLSELAEGFFQFGTQFHAISHRFQQVLANCTFRPH